MDYLGCASEDEILQMTEQIEKYILEMITKKHFVSFYYILGD